MSQKIHYGAFSVLHALSAEKQREELLIIDVKNNALWPHYDENMFNKKQKQEYK